MNVQLLPPKMAQEYANKAKNGEGVKLSSSCFEFLVGRQEVCLVSIDPPIGHVRKLSQSEIDNWPK